MKSKFVYVILITLSMLGIAAFLYWETYGLRVTKYTYSNSKLPQSFAGFKIVHISDFHNTAILTDKVVSLSREEKPDIIVMTGDLFDRRRTDVDTGMDLMEKLVEIAPVYYVRGNHENGMKNTNEVTEQLKSKGVIFLEYKKLRIFRGNEYITIMGIKDASFVSDEQRSVSMPTIFKKRLYALTKGDDSFKILLTHNPIYHEYYEKSGAELVLSGHTHGGQFGVPFTDYGVFVPDVGFFTDIAAGVKELGDTTMIISRGIGNSIFPFRLFNRPEVVSIEFK